MWQDYVKWIKFVVSKTLDMNSFCNFNFTDDPDIEKCLDKLIVFNDVWPLEQQKPIDFRPLMEILLEGKI